MIGDYTKNATSLFPLQNCHPEKQLLREHYKTPGLFRISVQYNAKKKTSIMSSLAINPLMPNLAAKPNLIDRTHYSAPSSGGIHHSHHSHSSKGGGKHSIALTALTLLSFLFFLNILQNCLQEHMEEMNSTQQVVIMQARIKENREVEAQKRKGEDEFLNSSSMLKESRNHAENVKSKPADRYTQIPVKLRTSEKAIKP